MKPVVDRLRTEYAGKIDIKRMDTDGTDPVVQQLANTFGIQYVPTFVFVNRDGTVVDTVVGEVPADALTTRLAKLR
jgi:thioredoxin-like negative regulator of GroEL